MFYSGSVGSNNSAGGKLSSEDKAQAGPSKTVKTASESKSQSQQANVSFVPDMSYSSSEDEHFFDAEADM